MSYLKKAVVLAALLGSSCERESLSVGELRCRGVSCAPHALDSTKTVDTEDSPEYARRAEPIEARVTALPCPIEGECTPKLGLTARLLTRDGETSVLVATPFDGYRPGDPNPWADGTGVWIARYRDGAWHGARFVRHDGRQDAHWDTKVAIAVDPDRPGEALVAISEVYTELGEPERRLRVFRFDERDDLRMLFEDRRAAGVRDAAVFDGDLLLAGAFQGNLELTRYALDGAIRWRQASLRSTIRSFPAGLYPDDAKVRVLDEQHIAMLVVNGPPGEYEVLVLDGDGEKLWNCEASSYERASWLETDPTGAIVVGGGAYHVQRIDLVDGKPHAHLTGRTRELFWDLDVLAFDVGPSRWAYVATHDGTFDQRADLIERVSPDAKAIESFEVVSGDPEVCADLSYPSALRVDPSEGQALVVTGECVAEISLPPPVVEE